MDQLISVGAAYKVLGGGRIELDSQSKTIKIYGRVDP